MAHGKRSTPSRAILASVFILPVLICQVVIRAAGDTMPDTWAATDALGRALPVAGDVRARRADRVVAIFYFLWMQPSDKNRIYDITQIRAADPAHPRWGPEQAFHWWSQPQFGYYASDDPWVIRKHAQMLTDAGVDLVVFDVTNSVTYDSTVLAIAETYAQIRSEGGRTPQIAFITHSRSVKTTTHLYESFYSKKQYASLWFSWLGKPLLMGPDEGLAPEVADFFTRRDSWAWSPAKNWFGDGKDKWPWIDHTPQNFGWHDSPKLPEEVAVSPAEHPTLSVGRSYQDGVEPPLLDRRPEKGLHFSEQWARALQVDPAVIFVTGWNEWIAQRFIRKPGKGPETFAGSRLPVGHTFFVDEYSEEFSRDLEPMVDRHTDNYYYQLVSNIRQFKGARPVPAMSAKKTIAIDGPFTNWDNVQPVYFDDAFDTVHRDHVGFDANMRYLNDSGRNDIVEARVARDDQFVYFYVKTREPLTSPTGDDWMTLLISSQSPSAQTRAQWQGDDLLINRNRPDLETCSVERCTGGWNWTGAGRAPMHYAGNQMHLRIPRSAIAHADEPLRFNFKWTDHATGSGTVTDFNDHGDVAPNGRFMYRYVE